MKLLHAYFDYGSPYSYLAYCRIRDHPERYEGVEVLWKPVSAGHIFSEEGGKPNAAYPNLLRTNKTDLARWARIYGVPMVVPPSFPCRTIEASRIHLLADQHGPAVEKAWMEACFHAHWGQGKDLGDTQVLAALCDQVGIEDGPQSCNHQSLKRLLTTNTQEAYEKGAPGVPYFELEGEMYWGNDRMAWLEAQIADKPLTA